MRDPFAGIHCNDLPSGREGKHPGRIAEHVGSTRPGASATDVPVTVRGQESPEEMTAGWGGLGGVLAIGVIRAYKADEGYNVWGARPHRAAHAARCSRSSHQAPHPCRATAEDGGASETLGERPRCPGCTQHGSLLEVPQSTQQNLQPLVEATPRLETVSLGLRLGGGCPLLLGLNESSTTPAPSRPRASRLRGAGLLPIVYSLRAPLQLYCKNPLKTLPPKPCSNYSGP